MPGDVNLWCGDKKAFYPTLVNPRVVRVSFNGPIYTPWDWTIDPSLGSFRGADGCAEALATSGVLQWAGGPHPGGKIWLVGISRYDSTTLDFTFNQAATSTGDASGFWCTDEWGNNQNGSSVFQPASEIIRVSFMSTIKATPEPAGIVAGFTGISEYADLLCPITWRV